MQSLTQLAPTGLSFQTRDGRAYSLRRATPADAGPLAAFLERLSARSRLMRYMNPRPFSPETALAEAARMAAGRSITLIVTGLLDGELAVIAVAELARDGDTGELAIAVLDQAQRKGIGGLLLGQLLQIAQELGLSRLRGDMLAENYPMQRLLRALALPYTATAQAGELRMLLSVPQRAGLLGAARPLRAGAPGSTEATTGAWAAVTAR